LKDASYLGLSKTSFGSVTVDGEGSNWRSSFGFVGYYGTGEVSILNGGRWTSSDVRIGQESGSMGMVSVAGPGSSWDVIGPGGSVHIGSFGAGSLNITNGGAMHSESTLLVVGLANNGDIQISGAGSTMSHTGTFVVGFAGRGEVVIQDGGSLRTGFGANNLIYADRIGETSTGSGYVIVEDQGSKWNSAQTLIGYNDGAGEMLVRNGAHVLTLDYAAVAHGNNAGNVAAGDSLAVVSGTGSVWQIGTRLNVGRAGSGELRVLDGGLVTSKEANVGAFANGIGHAVVAGPESKWLNSDWLVVGNLGKGTVEVLDGGVISTADAYLGLRAGTVGSVLVDGLGSRFNIANSLDVGGFVNQVGGVAGLEISNGGQTTVGSALRNWDHSRVDIRSGGTLVVGGTFTNRGEVNLETGGHLVTHSYAGSGGGLLNFTGGTLELTGGTYVGDLNLVSGTTLAGVGTIDGNLSLAGTLDPGNSPGTLAIDGDLTWHGGGRVHFDLGVGQSDLIDISGSLLKGAPGTWNFHFSDPGDFAPGTYTLLTFAGTDFTLADFSFTSDIAGFGGSFQFGGGGLQFSAVPEPSSLLLVSVGLLLGCRRRRSDWSQVA
jgi:T5SS/PEP-CTERM-associated repeat protein